jgi:hypothetical protein
MSRGRALPSPGVRARHPLPSWRGEGFWVALLLWLLFVPVHAADLDWRGFDQLPDAERGLAEATLFEMFGDNPTQWPDWIDPAALWVPLKSDFALVVRRPIHAPCGQYSFAIFGPVTSAGSREKLGDFCAGSLNIVAVSGKDWPDFDFREGRVSQDGETWQRLDQQLRYQNGQWWRILPSQ